MLLLECNDLSFSYHTHTGEISVIKSVSFRIHKGEFVSIVGPSGCGKSTLLGLLTGILSPEEGSIKIHYKQKGTQSFYGYMLQQDHLLEWYDIWDNVCLGPKINHCLDNACKEYLHTLLTRYQLDSFAHKKPSQLSGGMRQRAALIRTLAMKPELLYLDEPFKRKEKQLFLLPMTSEKPSVCPAVSSF